MVEETDLYRMLDLQTPWCLHVAATLRIPQHIDAGHGEIADLAASAGCDRDALRALLTYLVSKGVFHEPEPGRFACNHAAKQLAQARFLDLNGIGGRMAHVWGTLLGYVRTGKPAYQEMFGRPFWEDLAAHPEVAADFDALMGPAGHGIPDYDIELSAGWEHIRSIVDVGGGTGSMLVNLLRRHPHIRGTLVDLPATVARADFDDVADRATAMGQSFFDPLPSGAGLYLLRKVLNDWPDAETVAILRRCREAADPDAVADADTVADAAAHGGSVVVIGGVAPDDAPRPLAIDMLVAGGKTSTVAEFSELAAQAGLAVVAAREQQAGFVVECRQERDAG
ncbi:MAG: methyltransferase [Streptosporangiaceae bacterium]|nr:methyltransferase [Streptosporangiaceae bacterium]